MVIRRLTSGQIAARLCASTPSPSVVAMGTEPPPPPPPRPDLAPGDAAGPAAWRHGDPGRMGATRIVGAGLRLWIESWPAWAVVTLLLTGVIAILVAIADPWSTTYGYDAWFDDPAFGRSDPSGVAVVLGLVNTFFLGPWLYVILSRAALHATVEAPLRGSALFGGTIRGVHSLVWIFVLLILLAIPIGILIVAIAFAARDSGAVGVLFLIPLALFLYLVPRLATLPDVFVGDDARGSRAIGATWSLSRGAWPTAAGAIGLLILITIAISLVPGILAGTMFPDPVVGDALGRAIVGSLLNAVLTPIGVAIGAVLYLELKARKGALDQTSLREKLARFDRG